MEMQLDKEAATAAFWLVNDKLSWTDVQDVIRAYLIARDKNEASKSLTQPGVRISLMALRFIRDSILHEAKTNNTNAANHPFWGIVSEALAPDLGGQLTSTKG